MPPTKGLICCSRPWKQPLKTFRSLWNVPFAQIPGRAKALVYPSQVHCGLLAVCGDPLGWGGDLLVWEGKGVPRLKVKITFVTQVKRVW